jgi:hypothetical protein
MRHYERGQAVVETAIFLPTFLLLLFAIIWAAQAAVQYERTQSSLRYSSLVSQHTSPYLDFSLASMYSQLGSTAVPDASCSATGTTPLTAPLSDAAPTYVSTAGNTTVSPPFFSPSTSGVATPTCVAANYWGIKSTSWVVSDSIFNIQERQITSPLNIPPYLAKVFGTFTSVTATQYFYKQVGINVLLACYPDFNALVTSNLKPTLTASSGGTPTPILGSGSCTSLGNCQQFQNQDEIPEYFSPNATCDLQ